MADIFLSYAREDAKAAQRLAAALESKGWSVFWDRTSLLAGQDFEAVIAQAINQAGCMIVGWSEAARQSDWVRGEAAIGRERHILVPAFFEPVEPPIAFRSLHTENLAAWHGDPDAQEFLMLCQAIEAVLNPNQPWTTDDLSPHPSAMGATLRTNSPLKPLGLKEYWHWLSIKKTKRRSPLLAAAW